MKILVINPGSTTTKVALFEDLELLKEKKINHSDKELAAYGSIRDQLPMRVSRVQEFLQEEGLAPSSLDVMVARGGMLPPVRHGAYIIDETMVKTLLDCPAEQHASNLGAGIAWQLARENQTPAFIYDSVSVDELTPLARLSGVKGYDRRSFSHVLNTRAVAREIAAREGFNLEEVNVIVAHLGGGISLNLQSKGALIDIVSADEGPYSTERAGGLSVFTSVRIVKKEGVDALYGYEIGKGGLLSYTGSNDAVAIEDRALDGHEYSRLLYEGIAYQTAKAIGGLATVVQGQVRAIILTGGMARSKLITEAVEASVGFIAPVYVYPGELEMGALAAGGLRVMRGEEQAQVFQP
ncbi:MAG TPA: butyrate kinase [Bacillota bacterium]|jgi:butyrate kinase|nr:butyrate kinase [Fastidiosipila sp.]HPX93918.1 butyrate kinase [Bacillota bacterium]HQB81814.1 butyrate kinase [Bacillota bacterium]